MAVCLSSWRMTREHTAKTVACTHTHTHTHTASTAYNLLGFQFPTTAHQTASPDNIGIMLTLLLALPLPNPDISRARVCVCVCECICVCVFVAGVSFLLPACSRTDSARRRFESGKSELHVSLFRFLI